MVYQLKLLMFQKVQLASEYASAVDFAVAYTGVDGLTVGYAMGEDNSTKATLADVDTMYAKYAYGPVTVAYSFSERDEATAETIENILLTQ